MLSGELFGLLLLPKLANPITAINLYFVLFRLLASFRRSSHFDKSAGDFSLGRNGSIPPDLDFPIKGTPLDDDLHCLILITRQEPPLPDGDLYRKTGTSAIRQGPPTL